MLNASQLFNNLTRASDISALQQSRRETTKARTSVEATLGVKEREITLRLKLTKLTVAAAAVKFKYDNQIQD